MPVVLVAILLQTDILSANAFTLQHSSSRTTSLYAMNKRTKFSKQKALAEKMALGKRQREIEECGGDVEILEEDKKSEKNLSAEEIKLRYVMWCALLVIVILYWEHYILWEIVDADTYSC